MGVFIFSWGYQKFEMNEKGEALLPEGWIIANYTIENCTDQRRMSFSSYPTFLSAFREVVKRLNKKPLRYIYKIEASIKTETNSSVFANICYLMKSESGITFRFQNEDCTIPEQWFGVKRSKKHNGEVEILIQELKEKYNVIDVTFTHGEKLDVQLRFLQQVCSYFKTLEGIIPFHLVPPVSIATTKTEKWGGKYSDDRILLKTTFVQAFYHEYFHHVDHSTAHYRRSRFNVEKKDFEFDSASAESYFRLAERVSNDTTMVSYYQRCRYMLNEYNNLKPRYFNTKEGNYYEYWTRYDEVLARFFEGVMFKRFNDALEPDLRHFRFDYTQEEVERHQGKMVEFLSLLFQEIQVNPNLSPYSGVSLRKG